MRKGVPIADLRTFERRAVALGATVTSFEPPKGDSPLWSVWDSAPSGGCGLEGCSCSPALWVSAKDDKRGLTAHWGEGFTRGEVGGFTIPEFHQWEKFRKEVGL